ncbi:MAG: hydrogenase nickel incorporation protein HypB [bacterium]|nr:MAG: hydrogenase nickel incorporation protein HypB [bacterium]KAF0148891.1 MAG: hydrogenase nickel incorporation protein HypB [bacterium]KAF0168292.1 MAG: hydrogenase nickel incorporation protein HypB [bacterium]TXT20321.1 MAG: hydrogenase nickel incorporation protein HypB [bacterium]
MCTVCGCGQGETKIEGHEHDHPHDHSHDHSHPHTHDHDHVHVHGHEHTHADGTVHSHPHEHGHSHAHEHSHEHGHTGHDHHHDHLHDVGAGHSHSHAEAELHGGEERMHFHEHKGDLHYGLGPAHAHAPGLTQERMVRIEQDILGKNNTYAADNRRHFSEHGLFAVNLVSSPGSGKTTLLVKSIELLKDKARVAVVEGDQQTSHDADRIRATGAPAIQVNTGKGCHLDAHMVGHALERLNLPDDSLLMIENVGNLVCPAAFDLGEAHKVVILSVTEGEDKPLKYPDMFHAADLMILNKVDLLPYLNFDVDKCVDFARRVNPKLQVMQVSATSGLGLDAWLDWLLAGLAQARGAREANVALLKKRIAELEAALAAKG